MNAAGEAPKYRRDELHKSIRVRVVPPAPGKEFTKNFRAPKGKGFTDGGVDEFIEKFVAAIEHDQPGENFRLVQLGPAQFNFVHVPKEAE